MTRETRGEGVEEKSRAICNVEYEIDMNNLNHLNRY